MDILTRTVSKLLNRQEELRRACVEVVLEREAYIRLAALHQGIQEALDAIASCQVEDREGDRDDD